MSNPPMNYDELMANTLPKIRNHAATIGLGVDMSEKKADLVKRIVEFQQRIEPPRRQEEPKLADPKDEKLRSQPPAESASQKEIMEACKNHIAKGMVLTFPEDDQYHMRYRMKEDSGNIRQPLRTIVQRAEIICR